MKKIARSELIILNILWDMNKPISVYEILEILVKQGIMWKVQTATTLLRRLVDKEVVSIEKRERTYFYYPVISQQDYETSEAKKVINQLFDGSIKNFLSAFNNNEKLDKTDIDELKEWIDNLNA